eukprot:gene9983-13433_t
MRIKICSLQVIFLLLIPFIFIVWIYCALYLFVHKYIHNTDKTSFSSFKNTPIFAYDSNYEEYVSSIEGLNYNNILFQSNPQQIVQPTYHKLGDLLSSWNPDDTSKNKWNLSMAHPQYFKGLQRFNYLVKSDRISALDYRNAEIPFVIYNVPELNDAAKNGPFKSTKSILHHISNEPRLIEKSKNNHFMYYKNKNIGNALIKYPDWKPPQTDVLMSMTEYIQEIKKKENVRYHTNSTVDNSYYYLTISAAE